MRLSLPIAHGVAWLALLVMPVRTQAVDVLINEFMAINDNVIQDEDGDTSDWIELYNTTDSPVDLENWALTDNAGDLQEWLFPATNLPARSFLLVFASGKNRRVAGGELHTDFRLDGDGEFLALVRPDGTTIEHQVAPEFPPQVADMSYGVSWAGSNVTVLASNAACRAFVPTDASQGTTWVWRTGFDDSAWRSGTTGVGYGAARFDDPYDPLIGLDLEDLMQDENQTAYIRIPFHVDLAGPVADVTLNMRYDDGFVAYLNGHRGASALAPAFPQWDSGATAKYPTTEPPDSEPFEMDGGPSAIVDGTNVLAIHALNYLANSTDLLVLPELSVTFAGLGSLDALRYFTTPTPGAPNSIGYAGTSAAPALSHGSGTYTAAFDLVLTSPRSNAVIRYTLDQAAPEETSPAFAEQVLVSGTTLVRARAFEPGYVPSPVVSGIFIFLEPGVQAFTSDLPIVVVDNLGVGDIPSVEPKQPAIMAVLEPQNGVCSLVGDVALTTRIAARRRGETSLRPTHLKPNLAIESHGELDDDVDIEPLGMPADSDWILHAPYNFDRALVRNAFIFELSNQVGAYACRTRFCEVFLNAGGGALSSSDYAGVYVFMERIKQGDDRVDIEDLEPQDSAEPAVGGGYIFKIDKPDPGKTVWSAGGQGSMYYVYPAEENITTNQEAWLQGYIDDFGAALNGGDFTDPVLGYRPYLDTALSVDHHILNVLPKNVDALRLSTYIHKPRQGRLTYGPIWDFDRSMESTDGRDDAWNTWDAPNGTQFFDYGWWDRLFQDGSFWQEWIDRWQELRDGSLSTTNIHAIIDAMASELEQAQARNFQKWTAVLPRNSWQWEVDHLKEWLASRATWIDSQLFDRPAFGIEPGMVVPGTGLTMSVPPGTTGYYTLDGSDPRAQDGAVSAAARQYLPGVPVPITSNVVVRARATDGGGFSDAPGDAPWSGLREAVYIVRLPELAVTEVMYNPRDPTVSEAAAGFVVPDFEFVEIRNVATTTVSLVGVQFTEGVRFDFTHAGPRQLAPGAFAVVAGDVSAFTNRYGTGVAVAGTFSGDLDNGGENVVLGVPGVGPILSFRYDDGRGWPLSADGAGHALVPASSDAITSHLLDYGGHWRASVFIDGSPGAMDPAPEIGVVVNEIAAHTDYANPSRPEYDSNDWLELYNRSASPVTFTTNWFLSDDGSNLRKWQFPGTHAIAGHGRLALDEVTDFHNPIDEGFGLDKAGESVLLSHLPGDGTDRVVDAVRFKGQVAGTTLGRTPDGATEWGKLVPTRGVANAAPDSRVVISEIMYHPADVAGADSTVDEFLEVFNPTAAPVALWNAVGRWRIDGMGYTFPSNVTVAAGERLVVPSFSLTNGVALAAFRAAYGLAQGEVRILDGYGGKLSNRGERLALERPQASDNPLRPDDVSWVIVDEVIYFDASPWQADADGSGLSLNRADMQGDGNSASNWGVAFASPGVEPEPVAVVWPRDGQVLWTPCSDTLQVWVAENVIDGGVNHVDFFDGNTLVGTDATEPYGVSLDWLRFEGVHPFSAVLTDGGGNVYTSRQSVVTVWGPPSDSRRHYRTRVEFEGYDRASALESFPALVRLGSGISGFSYAQFASAAGGDLRFADQGESMSLPYEIESWDTNGTSAVWVRMPRLSVTNRGCWAYWGDPALASAPEYATDGTVWASGYHAVWHFQDGAANSAGGPVAQDHGSTDGAGLVGRARGFDGVGAYLDPGVDSGWFEQNLNGLTLSAWARPDLAHTGTVIGATGPAGSLFVRANPAGRFLNKWDFGASSEALSDFDVVWGGWQYVALALGAGQARAVRDAGVPEAVSTYAPFAPAPSLLVGCLARSGTPEHYFDGRIDELRISRVARTADWLWAEYATVAAPDFASYAMSAPADLDNDGMRDTWEIHYFGQTNLPAGAADVDWDGDGLLNGEEFEAGTDPTNAASRFELAITNAGLRPVVFLRTIEAGPPWHSGLDRFYSLERAQGLPDSAWQGIPGYVNIKGTGVILQYTNEGGAAARFFRGTTRTTPRE